MRTTEIAKILAILFVMRCTRDCHHPRNARMIQYAEAAVTERAAAAYWMPRLRGA